MTSFLLTEIALDLLGNKFYSTDGEHVRNLQTLYKLSHDELPTGEPSLSSMLSISEVNLKAADNVGSNIIVLEDDDDDDEDDNGDNDEDNNDGGFTISTESATLLEELSNAQHNIGIDDLSEDEETEVMFSTTTSQKEDIDEVPKSGPSKKRPLDSASGSGDQSKKIAILHSSYYQNKHDFTSSDVNERLSFIIEASGEEYARMRNQSNTLKKNFLDANRTLINLRALKEEDFLKKFYMQQKISLIEESNSLMQFIKIVKNEESYSKDVLIRVAGDILKAKDLIA